MSSETINISVIPFGTKCGKKVLIDFNDGDNRHTLYHEYARIEDQKGVDAVVAIGEDGKKTEFRGPWEYDAEKEKGRSFWEDLTEHGWKVVEK